MTASDAYKILTSKLPGFIVVKCVEFDTLFVFQIIPENQKVSISSDRTFDNLCSVNKATKEVRDFKPFHIPISECKRGKEVGDFK